VRDDFPIEAAAGHPRQHHHRDERAGLRDAQPRDRPKHRHDELAEAIAGVMKGIKIGHARTPRPSSARWR
jgi:hypothetical protein